jgi:transposase
VRYELSDFEWANDRRVLNDIFWVLRSGAPWRDLPVGMDDAPPATIVSSGGEGLENGAGLWTHLPALMMRRSK